MPDGWICESVTAKEETEVVKAINSIFWLVNFLKLDIILISCLTTMTSPFIIIIIHLYVHQDVTKSLLYPLVSVHIVPLFTAQNTLFCMYSFTLSPR